jgi:glyoxylase-like metal-dependent hydrolase (beta-lactamase superfamily II)
MIRLGEFELHAVSDGFFKLDGGAMFGIVPKPAWEKVAPADDRNRVQLSLTNLLLRAQGNWILVDTGIGTKHEAKFMEMYAVSHPPTTPESLAKLGVKPEDVKYVVLSHLHFDHAGGATVKKDGKLVATYPNATYIVQEGMWPEAPEPNPRTKGSLPTISCRWRIGPSQADPRRVRDHQGVRCVPPAAVRHHQVVRFEAREGNLLGGPATDDRAPQTGVGDGSTTSSAWVAALKRRCWARRYAKAGSTCSSTTRKSRSRGFRTTTRAVSRLKPWSPCRGSFADAKGVR